MNLEGHKMPRHALHALAASLTLGAMVVGSGGQAAPAISSGETLTVAGVVQGGAPFSNGGGQYWVAFDPNGRNIGNVGFMSKRIFLVNTSNQLNAYSIYDEPAHTRICAETLGPGQTGECDVQPGPPIFGDYFQVIAAQPVLVGGTSDTAYMSYTEQGAANGLADTSHGLVISVPLIWQQGCPPAPGNGCPDGRAAPLPTAPATTGRLP
jgi:hypothetical protein